jgi:hypothetical protein
MNATFQKVIAVLALSGMCLAQSTASSSAAAPKTKKKSTRAVAKKAPAATTEDLQRLQQTMQEQIDLLKQQVAERDQKLQQVQQQLTETQAASQQAQQKVVTVETLVTDQKKQTDASIDDVKGTLTSTIQTIQDDQKKNNEAIEHPVALRYKGINITPGGFIAAEGLWRQRAESQDVISTFNGIPFNRAPQSHLTEFRGTARQSRLSLLAEGKVGSTKLTGYWETDFLGAAPTANENQSTSFNLRQRQLFGQAALDSGWTFTAGQTWSLITLNKKGIETRGEWTPATIDAQYVVGFDFARLMTARVTKSFADKKATLGFSLEHPAYLVGGIAPPSQVLITLPGGGALGNGNSYSVNLAPDFIVKLALDPGFGHYEIKGIGRVFRDRVESPGIPLGGGAFAVGNNTTWGGGVGAGMILPVVAKKVDFIAQGLAGRGVARYTDSSNVDIVIKPDGTISTVKSLSALAGIETHPTPKLDVYVYGGGEYLGRNAGFETINGVPTKYGYGFQGNDYSKCYAPETTFSCSANFKQLYQGVAGFWYRFYKGAYGTLQYGTQFSYTNKSTWTGLSSTTPVNPAGNDAMVFTSFRYYIP